MDEKRGELLLESPADSAMTALRNEALATTTILAWLGPNLLSQRCYLVSLGQQDCQQCGLLRGANA